MVVQSSRLARWAALEILWCALAVLQYSLTFLQSMTMTAIGCLQSRMSEVRSLQQMMSEEGHQQIPRFA